MNRRFSGQPMPETKTGRKGAGSGFYVGTKPLDFGFPKVHICHHGKETGPDYSFLNCKSVM
jgi:hypothetical protein